MGIYNCASTLDEALQSLYAQTYQDFKIILCEDGSTDDTYQVAQRHAASHDNVILIRNERNMGLNYTLNRCLQLADTEYVARMDGDDISLPSRFEQEIIFLDSHPEYAVVSGPMIFFDENGEFRRGKGRGEVTKRDFLSGSPICHAPCMARTAVFKEVGGYSVSPRLLRVEDYHLWFKIYAAGYKAYMLQDSIYKMRDDRNAANRRTFKNRLNEAYVKHVGFKMLGLPFWCQIYSFRPFIVWMMPRFIYNYLHRGKK